MFTESHTFYLYHMRVNYVNGNSRYVKLWWIKIDCQCFLPPVFALYGSMLSAHLAVQRMTKYTNILRVRILIIEYEVEFKLANIVIQNIMYYCDVFYIVICDQACKNQSCECKLHQVLFALISSIQNALSHFCKLQKKAH